MNEKTNITGNKSRQWIVESLLSLMREKPYGEISVTEITGRAQLDRRTFYRHFNSKDEVLTLYMDIMFDEYQRDIAREEQLSLYVVFRTFFRFIKRHAAAVRLLQESNLSLHLLEKFNAVIIGLHNANKHRYEKREDLPNYEYALYFNSGGAWNITMKWVADGARETPEEMARLVEGLYLRMV